jgi:hypothetical protein
MLHENFLRIYEKVQSYLLDEILHQLCIREMIREKMLILKTLTYI